LSSTNTHLTAALQVLQQYKESIELGHSHVLQALPRLLTLYFELGSDVKVSVLQGCWFHDVL
jgi:hypothetical protein